MGSVAGFYRTAGCRPRLRDLKKKGYAKGVLTNMEDGEAFRDEGYAGAWCGAAACTFFSFTGRSGLDSCFNWPIGRVLAALQSIGLAV